MWNCHTRFFEPVQFCGMAISMPGFSCVATCEKPADAGHVLLSRGSMLLDLQPFGGTFLDQVSTYLAISARYAIAQAYVCAIQRCSFRVFFNILGGRRTTSSFGQHSIVSRISRAIISKSTNPLLILPQKITLSLSTHTPMDANSSENAQRPSLSPDPEIAFQPPPLRR